MLIIISPAKRIDENSKLFERHTLARKAGMTKELVDILKHYSPLDLQNLMGINPKLADLNVGRFQMFKQRHNRKNSLQSLFAFNGDVFLGLDAKSMKDETVEYAQNHLRILSGLYGVLRPLDLLQAYRLEMGTRLPNPKGNDLYSFWGENITNQIKSDLKMTSNDILFNLASKEYFKSIHTKRLKTRIISADFREFKDGEYKFYPVFGKKGRGLMSRFVLNQQITDPEQIKGFQEENYYFEESLSTENEFIFAR